MFTGLIENIGVVSRVAVRKNYLRLSISPEPMFGEMKIGESVAVSGPCLTVVSYDNKSFTTEVSQETVKLTTLKTIRAGDRVNLERALRADSRLGGHFVSGHIDCVLEVRRLTKIGQSLRLEMDLPREYARFVVDKGSVTFDGVSLTIIDLGESGGAGKSSFAVNIIPETGRRTTLADAKPGDLINVEFDLLGKYIVRFLDLRNSGVKVTIASLRDMGF